MLSKLSVASPAPDNQSQAASFCAGRPSMEPTPPGPAPFHAILAFALPGAPAGQWTAPRPRRYDSRRRGHPMSNRAMSYTTDSGPIQGTGESVPYPASFIDQLIDAVARLPTPYWLTYFFLFI